jgi:hypothetical protein
MGGLGSVDRFFTENPGNKPAFQDAALVTSVEKAPTLELHPSPPSFILAH